MFGSKERDERLQALEQAVDDLHAFSAKLADQAESLVAAVRVLEAKFADLDLRQNQLASRRVVSSLKR